MKTVELIYECDCPNIASTRANLMQAFSKAGEAAKWIEWDRSASQSPAHVRRYGSPTILVDGRDVAGETGQMNAACCRLYTDETGAIRGVPTVDLIASRLKASEGLTAPVASGNGTSGWKSSLAMAPAIAFALLPKLTCPACWPAYAGLLSSLGLGFLIDTKYLFPGTVVFLVFAIGALAFRANARHGLGPCLVGIGAGAIVLIGKFWLEIDAALYGGIGILVAASIWNAWPRRRDMGCPACGDE